MLLNRIGNNSLDTGVVYIPSQTCLGLINLYKYSNQKKYLDSVILALDYYKNIWYNAKQKFYNIAPSILSPSWFIQALYETYLITFSDLHKNLIFDVSDYLSSRNMFGENNPSNLNMSVATWMEGLTDSKLALSLKDENRILKYKNSIRIGYQNMLKLKMKSENKLVNNGYIESVNKKILRIDWNQHALHALLKIYIYDIL